MEKKYVSRYHLISQKMGCACVFATSNILVMYVLVSKHGKHLLLFEAGVILIGDRVMAGWLGAGTGHSVSMSEVVYIAGCRAWSVVKYLVGQGSRENW
jgi:hypothetical protein